MGLTSNYHGGVSVNQTNQLPIEKVQYPDIVAEILSSGILILKHQKQMLYKL